MTHDETLLPPTAAPAGTRHSSSRNPGTFAGTVGFTLLFGVTNVLSYVYLVAAGRHLAGTAFGVFNALLGMLTLAGVVASSVQTSVTATAVHHPSRSALMAINRRVVRLALPATLTITLAALPLSRLLGADAAQVAVCGLVALALQLACPSVGFMLGLGMIWQQAAVGLLGTIGRLGLGVPLMAATGSVVAGLAGYLVNHLIVLAAATMLAWRRAASDACVPHDATVMVMRVDRTTMATYIAVFLPFSLDQMLVQFVAPQHGGSYAALGTMAKLVFFAAYPLIATAFPAIVRQRQASAQLRIAGLALAGVAVVAGVGTAALVVLPRQILALFFGDRFSEASTVLPTMALGAFAFTVSVLAAHLLIAWRSRWAAMASLLPFAAGAALYAARHESLEVLVMNQFVIYAGQLLLIAALVAVESARQRPTNGPSSTLS